jgi:hypothetical protein
MHRVEYDDSFVENFPALNPVAQRDVSAIGAKLGENWRYLPKDDPDFVCERSPDETKAACQKITGWGRWKLAWYFEYFDFPLGVLEAVVLMIEPGNLVLTDVPLVNRPAV